MIKRRYFKGASNIARAVAINDFLGKPNSVVWRGFGPQTVKLISADISNHDNNEDIITYTFSASATQTNFNIPSPFGTINVVEKLGWQLLSISSRPYVVAPGVVVEAPWTAHIDELKETIDLNGLI